MTGINMQYSNDVVFMSFRVPASNVEPFGFYHFRPTWVIGSPSCCAWTCIKFIINSWGGGLLRGKGFINRSSKWKISSLLPSFLLPCVCVCVSREGGELSDIGIGWNNRDRPAGLYFERSGHYTSDYRIRFGFGVKGSPSKKKVWGLGLGHGGRLLLTHAPDFPLVSSSSSLLFL
jgi:hypothetical protein